MSFISVIKDAFLAQKTTAQDISAGERKEILVRQAVSVLVAEAAACAAPWESVCHDCIVAGDGEMYRATVVTRIFKN
jgi:hypothetical protein